MLLLVGSLGLLGVGWDVIARIQLQAQGIRVSGYITGSESRTQTAISGARTISTITYYLTFNYTVDGYTYTGTWETLDQSLVEHMPAETPITVSYPPGLPSQAQPVGDPFDSSNNPLLLVLGVLVAVLLEGFLPLLLLLVGVALLRGVLRGRTLLTEGYPEDQYP